MASETETSPPVARFSRRRLRATTGCLTCRQRHIKCDEGKPKCVNCGKRNRSCRYGNAGPPALNRRTLSKKPGATTWPEEDPAWNPGARLDVLEETFDDAIDDPQPSVSSSPFIATETVVSPFLATLESILLDADYPHDVPTGLQAAPIESVDQLRDVQFSPEALHADCPIRLSGVEVPVFRNYVDNVSRWIDSFSHDQPFYRQVPTLALKCPSLLNSCLALSAKQLSQVGLGLSYGLQEGDAVRYYRLALNAIRTLLLHPGSAHSDEVLAACIILSTYEMIDVTGDSLGSHLTGVASLLQSRQVCGDVAGIRGSCYWTWYRHELWAAIRTGRRLSLDEKYWHPPHLESFDHLAPEEIANRIIFLFGQCINFCNDDESMLRIGAEEWLRDRSRKATLLEQALDEWQVKLPASMTCFASEDTTASQMELGLFGAMWFLFPQSAVANQVYHASKIVLHLHNSHEAPMARGLANCTFLTLRKTIDNHRRKILLTANSKIPDAWSLLSSQCLYIAGLVTEGQQERLRTLELIDQCQRDTGRQTGCLSNDLRRLWDGEVEI